jgi:gliding motility-associated-like protein
VADFSASVTSGCAPLGVQFKDLSTGNPKFWTWDLGNGQLSNQQNPAASYAPGKYTVTLVVRNADGTNGITKTDLIVSNPSPQAAFTADITTACLPANIKFRDVSVANAGTITKWEWDFGDGTKSTAQHPQKSYTATGFYTVTLKVTSSTGCTNTAVAGRYIRIVSGVQASFFPSNKAVCRTPVEVWFDNQTSGPGDLSYTWQLGNGEVSTLTDPVIPYATAGTYNVRLIAVSSLGCSDTTERTVTIKNTLTSFTAPDSACINQPVTFTNGSPSAVTSNWSFGDDSNSDQRNAVKRYANPGQYTVKLVNSYADCTDSAEKKITIVDLPAVTFSSDKQGSCKAPFTVNFQDNSTDAVNWLWDFGDGTTGTGKTVSHTYTRTGSFDVSLTITSKFGCQNTRKETAFIQVLPPSFAIVNAPAGACVPFVYTPVVTVNAIDGVAGYFWDFGDGSTSTSPNPTHTYSTVGTYDLKLTITSTGGCTASVTVPGGVRTGTFPAVAFNISTSQSCPFDSVQFTDLSVPADEWLWNFGNGKTSTLRNPKHAYDSVGTFDVTLIATNNGCPQRLTKPAVINITPPIAKFTSLSNCNNRLSVTFVDESITNNLSPVTYLWEFGDPANSTSTAKIPSFVYPAVGVYKVKLTITNGSCSNSITKDVTIVSDIADFSANKTTLCKNEKLILNAINSDPGNLREYVWTVNGVPVTAGRTFETTIPEAGSYDVSLRITDLNGCTDTKSVTGYITVTGPTAVITASADSACVNSTISFTDASLPAGNINKWTFNFGDGTTRAFTAAPFTYAFKDTGNFQVTLTVEDKQGCTHVTSLAPINITQPVVHFGAEQTKACPEMPLQFRDSTTGYAAKYLWEFGDGSTSTDKDPLHTYAPGDKLYSVKLTVTDINGCTSSSSRANFIDVKAPKPAFDIEDTVTICPPLETKFFFKAKDYDLYYWDFGDGTTSILENPTHFYNVPGTYSAKLYVTGFGGCLTYAEHMVNVYDPKSSVINYTPLDACNELLVDFSITTPPGTKFQLHFADGASDTTQRKTLQHFYATPSTYHPYIILTDATDCQVVVGGTQLVRVIGADPFFSADKTNFCDSGTVYFTNYTIGNDKVISDTWNFGDGQTSADKDPIHTYTQPGTYVASHIVHTENGCSKTITDTIRVYRTPEPLISSDDVVCINSPSLFEGSLAVADTAIKWNWNLGNGQRSTDQKFNYAYNTAGQYTLTLEASNQLGCKSTDTKTINIAPLPVVTVAENPVISLGSEIKLPVSYSQNVITYNWSPANTLDCTNCPNPVATPKFNTTYKVNVTDSNSCKNTGEITVSVVCNNKNFFVPNTFSPNGDGVNDYFYPRGSGIDRVQSMRIFNRWGELVFEKRNFSVNSQADGWNGTHKGKAANGDVYVYVIEFICENAIIVPFKGNVALIR